MHTHVSACCDQLLHTVVVLLASRNVCASCICHTSKPIVKKGINSFKFFMAYKGALMVGDELLLDGMQRCKELGAVAMVSLLPIKQSTVHCITQLHLTQDCLDPALCTL